MAWGVPKIGANVIDATGNFDLIEPVGVAQGDLMVACIAFKSNAAITAPSGWSAPTELVQNTGDTDATDGNAGGVMFWIIRGSSAPDLTCTRTAGDVAYAKIISYSGAASSPYDVGSSAFQAVASATPTTASLFTSQDNELIVAMVAMGDQYTASAFDAATDPSTASGATDTTTAPTAGTWIERFDASTNTGADVGIAIADAVKATAGSTGTIQTTVSAAFGQNVIMAAAFKNAAPTTVLSSPADTATISDSTPTLEFTGTDSGGESVRYHVQVATSSSIDGNDTKITGTGANDSAAGDAVWANPTRINTDDASNATTTSTSGQTSHYLKGTNYGFTIPGTAVIAGIEVNVERHSTLGATSHSDAAIRIVKGGTIGSTDKSNPMFYPTSATVITYGGPDDLWGETWTPTDINGSTFGFAMRVLTSAGSTSAAVDYISIKVYYWDNLTLNEVSGTDSGFVNTTDGGDTDPFDSGDLASFTVQGGDALADNTYYWRVRAKDPSGSNTYGAWATTRSFLLSTVPPVANSQFLTFMGPQPQQ